MARIEPTAFRSRIRRSTAEPHPRSSDECCVGKRLISASTMPNHGDLYIYFRALIQVLLNSFTVPCASYRETAHACVRSNFEILQSNQNLSLAGRRVLSAAFSSKMSLRIEKRRKKTGTETGENNNFIRIGH